MDGHRPAEEPQTFDSFLDSVRQSLQAQTDPGGPLRRLHERLQAMTARFGEVQSRTFQGLAADGQITAEVDGRGKVLHLDISPHAIRDLRADDIGPACVEAIRAARHALSEELSAELRETADFDLTTAEPVSDPVEIWRRAKEASGWNPRS